MRNRKIKKSKRRRKQNGRWLNKYDFVYTGRGAANTGVDAFNGIAPGLMKISSREIDLIAEKRIKRFIKEGWREVQIVTPIIIKNAI